MSQRDPSLFLSPLDPQERDTHRGEEEPRNRDDHGGARSGSTGGTGGDDGDGPRSRRRLGAVAVVAVLLLAAFGANRMTAGELATDGDDEAAPGTTGTTEPERPSTTRRRPRATTTVPETLQTMAVLGPLLPDATGTTVVLASSGRLAVADLDTGTVRTVGAPGLRPYAGYPFETVLAVPGGFLVSGSQPHLVPRDAGGDVLELDVPPHAGFLRSGEEGRFWTVGETFTMELVERDVVGETGRRLTLPPDTGAILPTGDGFVVSPYGSVLEVDAGTGRAERIADGAAVAVDERTLARVRCDDDLDCGLVISDRDGGRERFVPQPTPRSRYDSWYGARLSPDGRWLVIPFYAEDQPGGLALVDVEAGERRQIDSLATSSEGGFPLQAVFTADSRWLLLADAGSESRPIRAIRIDDGATAEIDLGIEARPGEQGSVLIAVPSVPADADPAD